MHALADDSTTAFDGLADDYARHRPDYPADLFARLADLLPSDREIGAVDVGAGTGISSRALARGLAAVRSPGSWKILALEPGEDMRRQAERTTPPGQPISYARGTAERLACPDASADLVLTAQAVHWFDRPAFYREATRVLKPAGYLVIAYNNRQIEGNGFMEDYEAFLESHSPRYGRRYRDIDFEAELGALDWASAPRTWSHAWQRSMSVEDFIGMSRSSSKTKAAIELHGWPAVQAALRDLTERHAGADGLLTVPYVSALQFVQKER